MMTEEADDAGSWTVVVLFLDYCPRQYYTNAPCRRQHILQLEKKMNELMKLLNIYLIRYFIYIKGCNFL